MWWPASEQATRPVSSEASGEWMYVFNPTVGGRRVYVKLVLREDCVLVSFHEDESGGHEEEE